MQLTVLKEQFFQNRKAETSPSFVFATFPEQQMLFIAFYVLCTHFFLCVFLLNNEAWLLTLKL